MVTGGNAPYFASEPQAPTRRPRWYAAAGGVLLIAAASGVVALVSQSASHHSLTLTLSPEAFVSAAAHQTMAKKSADVVLGGSVQVQGYTLPVHGGGVVDFSSHAMDVHIDVGASGHSITEAMRLVDHNLYLSVNVDGTNGVLRQTGTASWLEMPITQSITASGAGTDPVATLSLLEEQGASVEKLGSRQVDGVDCLGFSVTPTAAMMAQAAKAEVADMGLSPSQQAQVLDEVKMEPPTITLWIDQHRVLHQMTESLQMTTASSGSASGQIVFDFRDYGAPVEVTAPAASEVVPFNKFISQFGTQGGQ